MNIVTKRTIAFALSLAAVAAAVTPSLAQTRAQRMQQPLYQAQEPYWTQQQQQRWGVDQVPGYVWSNPYQCWSDEGYGRFSSCENGGGGS